MNDCNTCNNPCKKGCKPARYSGGFSQSCDCPEETDTKLSIDYTAALLNYSAERHLDQITGGQLGSIINFGDLRDTDFDYDFDAMCAEAIFHRYGECGDGCKSLEDAWKIFSIDQEGAKKNQIRYVRGANQYGCPVYLDVPSRELEYWFAGWRPDGEFGYYQAPHVDKLPTDENGDPIIMTEDPQTHQPQVSTFPLKCLLDNLLQNFGVRTEIGFQAIQATPLFSAKTDNVTGKFDIEWNDWWGTDHSRHIGTGHILGQITWDYNFDISNGRMSYVISNIYFDKVNYVTDQGQPAGAPTSYLTLKGLPVGGGTETVLMDRYVFNPNTNWTETLNKNIAGGPTFNLAPGESAGPFNFLYLYNDWSIEDDEGYLNITFRNVLSGWDSCF